MPPLTLYIVYHKVLYPENTEEFTDNLLDNIKWVAVNEQIQKEYPSFTENRLIKEWEMKEFSPLYQMQRFYQNSFFTHLYKNQDLITTKYIGFAQYDQKIVKSEFELLLNTIESDKADKFIGSFPYPYKALEMLPDAIWEKIFVEPYNKFYHMNITLEELKKQPMFLLHTFIMPTWFFKHMMPFVEHITPSIIKLLNWDNTHIAGILERIYALCIACGIIEGKFRQILGFPGIKQCDLQRTPDPVRGIN
jgi:hypothetical protein